MDDEVAVHGGTVHAKLVSRLRENFGVIGKIEKATGALSETREPRSQPPFTGQDGGRGLGPESRDCAVTEYK